MYRFILACNLIKIFKVLFYKRGRLFNFDLQLTERNMIFTFELRKINLKLRKETRCSEIGSQLYLFDKQLTLVAYFQVNTDRSQREQLLKLNALFVFLNGHPLLYRFWELQYHFSDFDLWHVPIFTRKYFLRSKWKAKCHFTGKHIIFERHDKEIVCMCS